MVSASTPSFTIHKASRRTSSCACTGDTELGQALQREEVRVLYKPFNATALVHAIERTVDAAPR